MKIIINLIIFLLFHCTCTSGQRISEIKCHEYSAIPTNSLKPQPHLVWLRIATEGVIIVGVVGSLISENFVLTSAVSNLIEHRSQVYFRPDESYTIVKRFTHPFFDGRSHFDVGLLKLQRPIELNSFHRPACLWTSDQFELTRAELITWNIDKWTDEFDVKTLKILEKPECGGLHPQQNESLVCTKPIAPKDNHYVPASGSPIQIHKPHSHLPNNYYIYGIHSFFYSNTDPHISVGSKVYGYLNWIELNVWHQDVCGVVSTVRSSDASVTLAGEFPWQVAIYRITRHAERFYKCEGILLNELTVLTARTCVFLYTRTPGLLLAILGLHDLELVTNYRQERRVDRVIILPQTESDLHQHNLAILKLKTMASYSLFIQPICLSSDSNLFKNHNGVLPGWGLSDFDISASSLSKGFFSIDGVDEKSFSKVYLNETGACSGGLGGGLVVEVGKYWYLHGIMLSETATPGQRNCDPSIPVSFTNVVKWNEWIQGKM